MKINFNYEKKDINMHNLQFLYFTINKKLYLLMKLLVNI